MGEKVRVNFTFDAWTYLSDGTLDAKVLLNTEAAGIPGTKSVIFRLALLQDQDHLDRVLAGSDKPEILQSRLLSPTQAREIASVLEAAADVAEGRTPRPQG